MATKKEFIFENSENENETIHISITSIKKSKRTISLTPVQMEKLEKFIVKAANTFDEGEEVDFPSFEKSELTNVSRISQNETSKSIPVEESKSNPPVINSCSQMITYCSVDEALNKATEIVSNYQHLVKFCKSVSNPDLIHLNSIFKENKIDFQIEYNNESNELITLVSKDELYRIHFQQKDLPLFCQQLLQIIVKMVTPLEQSKNASSIINSKSSIEQNLILCELNDITDISSIIPENPHGFFQDKQLKVTFNNIEKYKATKYKEIDLKGKEPMSVLNEYLQKNFAATLTTKFEEQGRLIILFVGKDELAKIYAPDWKKEKLKKEGPLILLKELCAKLYFEIINYQKEQM